MATNVWIGGNAGNETNYATAANWTLGAAPVATNDVIIPAEASDGIALTLDQSAVQLASFVVEEGYAGTIGSATAALQIDVANTGKCSYAGSGAFAKIDNGASEVDWDISGTGTPSIGQFGLELTGTAIGKISVTGGSHVGFGTAPGASSPDVDNIVVGSDGSNYLELGAQAIAVASIQQSGGTVVNGSTGTITLVNMDGGTFKQFSGVVTTLTAIGTSVVELKTRNAATLTVTTCNLHGSSIASIFETSGAITITTLNMYSGASWNDCFLDGTYTNPIECEDGVHTVNLNLGTAVKLAPAAI